MSGAFKYKPKFVDIRVRPPKSAEEEAAENDVNALKPGEVPCQWPGCRLAGTARAPKSREMLEEHYMFCVPHAGEYNKGWNFFAGLSEEEVRRRQTEESFTGGRPTWAFKASPHSREAAAEAAKHGTQGFADPFGIFRKAKRRAEQREETATARRLGKIERMALSDLDLDVDAEQNAIRSRYKELLKRLHPDANGGDRSTEGKLQRVIKAYKALQKAGLA
jgi:hypothetical protein